MSGTDAAAILIENPINYIMAAIFDCPVTSIHFEDTFGIGLFRCATGHPQSDLIGDPAGFFENGLTFDQEYLADMREIKIPIKRSTAPDAPRFDSAVIGRCDLDKVRLLPIFKEQGDIRLERWLIVFNGEVVMCPASNHIGCQFALRQKRIGGDVPAFDVDCVQQRYEHADFISLLGFVAAVYGQSADFFWV